MDVYLVIEMRQAFNRKEKMDEFNAALLQQFKMRVAAERAAK